MTPGPYKVLGPFHHGAFDSRYEVVNVDDSIQVALCVFARGDKEAQETALADANAIAAIPRMRELLQHAAMRSRVQASILEMETQNRDANLACAAEWRRWANMFEVA